MGGGRGTAQGAGPRTPAQGSSWRGAVAVGSGDLQRSLQHLHEEGVDGRVPDELEEEEVLQALEADGAQRGQAQQQLGEPAGGHGRGEAPGACAAPGQVAAGQDLDHLRQRERLEQTWESPNPEEREEDCGAEHL